MTNHPLTPPPKLVDKWEEEWRHSHFKHGDVDLSPYIATHAAQWGADQELEACIEWVRSMFGGHPTWADELRAARRPKPPSLKEEALMALLHLDQGQHNERCLIIRRALEALPE